MLGGLLFAMTIMVATAAGDIRVDIDEEMDLGSEVAHLRDHLQFYLNLKPDQIPYLTYAILNPSSPSASYFRIDDPNTGIVTVAKRMDREAICDPGNNCSVKFDIAIQSGANTNVTIVTVVTLEVVIRDINDNPPTFPAREVTLEFNEGAKVGSELKIGGAVDRDSKPEFTVGHYNITPAIDVFSITYATNLDGSSTISLRLEKELDREKVDSYHFNIVAYDGGSNPQNDYLSVTVRVLDDNDNSPMFNQSKYDWKINDDEVVGALVGQVTATDKDIGDFGRITYSFSSSSEATVKGIFAINSSTGWIILQSDLRAVGRSSPSFLIFIEAKDGGDPPQIGQTRVSIAVMSSGNNLPFIKINTVFGGDVSSLSIPESALVDHFLAYVDVQYKDGGDSGKIWCQILPAAVFRLNPVPNKGYTLLLDAPVDREKKDSYSIQITCNDGGISSLGSTVSKNLTVNITDVNDQPPRFFKDLYTGSVDENRDAGQFVAQVFAQDDDLGTNAEITYSVPSDAQEYIRINPRTGVISTSKPFDREKNPTLRFKILATDGGEKPNTAETEIYIIVKDINDNSPQFNKSKFLFLVSEQAPNKTIIGTLTAFDLDADVNSQFDFYFGGSGSGDLPLPFTVLKNGSVQVTGQLDRETKAYYTFTTIVRDRGDIPRSSAVPVEIKVLDENDNDPVILFPTSRNHTIVISSFPENGMVLGRIIAYDVDEDDASGLRYFIFEGNEDEAFSIGVYSGELAIQNAERLQNPQEYYLYIKVEDSSSRPRNTTTQLRIEVRFENLTSASAFTHGEGTRDKYVIIVGVIGGATVVLSAIILSAIFIILRSEKKRRVGEKGSSYKNKFFSGTSVQAVINDKPVDNLDATKSQSNSSLVSDPHGLVLIPGNLSRKNDDVQKKVSFSLQDEFHDQGQVLLPEKQLRLNLPPGMDSTSRWKKLNNPDDINSDASGESGTYDSGRGTSEEDIKFDHSPCRGPPRARDLFMLARDFEFDQFRNNIQPNFLQVPNTNGHQPAPRNLTSTPPSKPERRPIQESGNGHGDRPQTHARYHIQRQSPPSTFTPCASSLSGGHHSHEVPNNAYRSNNVSSGFIRPASAMSYAQQSSAYSVDDDASSTTSGSYIVSSDEVKLEGFLGKDVVV